MVKVTKPKAKKWSEREIGYLMRNYYQSNARTIATELGRTVESVESKVYALRRDNKFSHAAKLADAPKEYKSTTVTATYDKSAPQPKSLWQRFVDYWKS